MVLCDRPLNQMKGRIFNLRMGEEQPVRPIAEDTFQDLLSASIGNITAQNVSVKPIVHAVMLDWLT